LLVDLVPAGALEVEQPREETGAGVLRNDAPHDRADLRIDERHRQLADERAAGLVVRVEHQDDLVRRESQGVIQPGWLAARPAASAIERLDEGMSDVIPLEDLRGGI